LVWFFTLLGVEQVQSPHGNPIETPERPTCLGFSPLPLASLFFVSSCNWLMSFRLANAAYANNRLGQKRQKALTAFSCCTLGLLFFFLFTVGGCLIDFKSAKATKSLRNILSLWFLSFSKHICFGTGFLLLTRFISPLNFCF